MHSLAVTGQRYLVAPSRRSGHFGGLMYSPSVTLCDSCVLSAWRYGNVPYPGAGDARKGAPDTTSAGRGSVSMAVRIQVRLRPTAASMPACGGAGSAGGRGEGHVPGSAAGHSATGTSPGGTRSNPPKYAAISAAGRPVSVTPLP